MTQFLLGKTNKQTQQNRKRTASLLKAFSRDSLRIFLRTCGCICLLLMYIIWYHHSCPLDCQHGGNPALFCVCGLITSFKVNYLFMSFNHFFLLSNNTNNQNTPNMYICVFRGEVRYSTLKEFLKRSPRGQGLITITSGRIKAVQDLLPPCNEQVGCYHYSLPYR